MTTARILNICLSNRKGIAKTHVPHARLVENSGLENDAHAGNWHRQVSLLDINDIREMEAKGLDLDPGAFGENLVIEGLALDTLGIGSRLGVGDAVLEITQIGKVCHDRCAIYYTTGDCIMPRKGIFARVLSGAEITEGSPVSILHSERRDPKQLPTAATFVPGTTLEENTREAVNAREAAHD